MSRSIKTFRNVRSRVCRTADGAWLAGWVVHLTQLEARIRLQSFMALDKDERLIGECYGDGSLARFTGRVVAQVGQDIAISICGSMLFEPSKDSVRLQVDGVQGRIWNGVQKSQLIVMDLSPQSLGGLVDQNFVPGTILSMALDTPLGPFSGKVSVINCRTSDAEAGFFRIGLQIAESSRLDNALWGRLLDERAAA